MCDTKRVDETGPVCLFASHFAAVASVLLTGGNITSVCRRMVQQQGEQKCVDRSWISLQSAAGEGTRRL